MNIGYNQYKLCVLLFFLVNRIHTMPTEKWKFPYSLFSPITHIIIWAHFGLRIGCKKAAAYVIGSL